MAQSKSSSRPEANTTLLQGLLCEEHDTTKERPQIQQSA